MEDVKKESGQLRNEWSINTIAVDIPVKEVGVSTVEKKMRTRDQSGERAPLGS